MSVEPLYVFDTSALISALLFENSVPAQAFYSALEAGRILVSKETMAELTEVLQRKKFDRYLSQDERDQFLAMLLMEATVVEITEETHVCRDSRDDKFLDLAVCGAAACVITGDADLLALHPFRGIPILSPAQFLQRRTDPNHE
jgi:putative PIN family toxin of toxin-antitoxin system